MKRFILILLICAMLVSCLAACDLVDDSESPYSQPEVPTNAPTDNSKGEEESNNNEKDQTSVKNIEIEAHPFIQQVQLSYEYSYYVKVIDGKTYLGDDL